MFNKLLFALLGAFVLVNLTIVTAADQPQCENCIGASLNDIMTEYDQNRHCWFAKGHQTLLTVKLYAMEAITEFWNQAIVANNALIEDACKSDVQVSSCEQNDTDERIECLVGGLQKLVAAHNEQEQCHGSAIKSDEMRTATRLLVASNKGWRRVHPDC